jgi:hypothetical protein
MQDHRAMDRALARLARAAPKQSMPGAPPEAAFFKHINRFGGEGVLYTAWKYGLSDSFVWELATYIDLRRVEQGGKYAKPTTRRKLLKEIEVLPKWLR